MDTTIVFLGPILIIASIQDAVSLRIPNWVTLPGLVVGLSYFTLTRGYDGFLFSLIGALTGLGLLIVPYIGGSTGAGDVKLMGTVGSFLGAEGVFIVFILSYILGGVYALVLLASNRLLFGALKRYGTILRCLIGTWKMVYIPPSITERALKVRFGVVIALGTGIYLIFWVLIP